MAVQQIPDGGWVSHDGRWLWRDGKWIPMPPAGQTGIFWFTSTPDWVRNILLMGLIGLIPFVGSMNIYGYAIVTARNLRAGHRVLPPANFSYLALGAPVFVLTFAWAVIAFFLLLTVGTTVGFAVYGQSHNVAWAIALGVASGFTVFGVLNYPALPLFVPALEMSDREGWGIFRIGRLVRNATQHWRATWYGVGILLVWYALYYALALVLSVVPFGGILAAIAGLPVLAPMVAIAISRYNDPPAGFGKGAANALAAGTVALWLLVLSVPWVTGVVVASYLTSNPEEVACFFDPRCTFNVTHNVEAIARVHRDTQDPTLVTVEVTYINRSTAPATVDPVDYYARPFNGGDLRPSADCPGPQAAVVAPGQRLTQRVCFRLPTADAGYEIHLPWIGWDSKTI
jgi:hypothetical protein